MQPAAFSWLRGEIHVDVVVGVVLLTGAYTWATVASRRPTPLGAPLAFFGGCAAMLAALNGPRHELSDYYRFSPPLVRHLLLTLVVRPRWLPATPAFMHDAPAQPAPSTPGFRPVRSRLPG